MEGLINIQLGLSSAIKKSLLNYKKSPKDRITKEYIEARIENLERDWSLFRTNHAKLYEISKSELLEKSPYVVDEIYDVTEENYFIYKSILKSSLKSFLSIEDDSSHVVESGKTQLVRLPKICIPNFTGNYAEWTTFRDLFMSLIHNNQNLDNVQKLHYLKSHLTGEAEQLIRHIPITEANYSQCWSLLEHRFNNKKFLANSILKRLFSIKRMVIESASGIKEVIDTTIDCLNALKNIDVDVSTWDIIIIHIVVYKLDLETRKQWELHHSDSVDLNKLPTLEQFKCFMESRFRALEFVDAKSSKTVQKINNSKPSINSKAFIATKVSGMRCEFCSEKHKLCFCKKFAGEDLVTRRDFVVNKSICFNCLGSNHRVYECKSPGTCRVNGCKKRHHSLLHQEIESGNTGSSSTAKDTVEGSSKPASAPPIVSCLSTQRIACSRQVLLATAVVKAESKAGKQILRALIDQGSQACFITETAVQLLRLKRTPVSGIITGLGGGRPIKSNHVVTLKIGSRNGNHTMEVTAYVLKCLTSYLPEQKIEQDWMELQNLYLADPQFDTPNKIDMLLGANVFSQILQDGMKRSPNGNLIAQSTTLGWILTGVVNDGQGKYNDADSKITVMHAQVTENDMLKQFWELEEEKYCAKTMWTEEEKRCEQLFLSTTKRTDEGRYIVQLPFRDNEPGCLGGNSRQIAVTKFKALEQRLSKNLDLKKRYTDVINEYLQLGHMRPVKKEDHKRNEAVYLPHHAVVREDKTTTKVRVVFNASSKNNLGVSLNDTLMVGPKLQADLRHIVLRWRVQPIVLIADIIKMYRQVKIAEEHTIFQRIVWRETPETEIRDYELLTVTFGTASAPYLAVKALNQVSSDEGKHLPLASCRVVQSFYMDDLMTGCSSIEEGLEVYKQMTTLLGKGGFRLQKWNSNNKELLDKILKSEKEQEDIQTQNNQDKNKQNEEKDIHYQNGQNDNIETKDKKDIEIKENTTRVLGLTWNRSEDQFTYSVNLPQQTSGPETKRTILSVVARLYDPLGWIAPSIVVAKMFIQKLWLSGSNWDDPISEELKNEWCTYRKELEKLTAVHVPRWLGTSSSMTEATIELHGFCDASKLAYGAVVYLRLVDSDGAIQVSLVAAKTRVAPIKQVSIPRLELCGAVLLSRLLAELAEVLSIQKDKIKAWTDSTVVLAWLNSHPSRWKTFVANRTTEILTTVESAQWYHISSKDNPADCASRGIQPESLAAKELWFSGPSFLREQNIKYERTTDFKVNLEEVVKSHVNIFTEDSLFQRYSSLQKLLRVVAYCRRFYKNKNKRSTYLSKEEIEEARICCIRKAQREAFNEEYTQLKNKNNIQLKNSKLKALCPYLDDNGILRVSGRLHKAQLAEQIKHPIILPHSSHLTRLVVSDAHQNTLHGGIQLMINYLRSAYWIIGAKNLVKQHIRQCVKCVRQKAIVQNQFMGSLPSVRCTPARAFFHSGVDYAGPINVRTTKGRGHRSYKGYICLFICMATRAIHLEMVSDMSTQSFLAAFRRFVGRRGHCAQMWSDNGTTFVGAARELQQLNLIQKDIAEHLETNGTKWHFIPPHAPNFGGLWEAGVKATKYHLKRVIGESTLTFEEMCTLLIQVEACLNSRPISVDSSDPSDPLPLTPGHFLIGESLLAVPDENYLDSAVSSLTRWQFIQRMLQCFWRRWSQEYLTNFMNRYKWSSRVPEPNIGDVILVKENDMPPGQWLMGRILEKHPGADGITRVVTIKTKRSIIKRPTSKVCVLVSS